ncbi:MAG: tetratricopeptide repeat protein [Promethearchaeota archaeon]
MSINMKSNGKRLCTGRILLGLLLIIINNVGIYKSRAWINSSYNTAYESSVGLIVIVIIYCLYKVIKYANQDQSSSQTRYSNRTQYSNRSQYSNRTQYSNRSQYSNKAQYPNRSLYSPRTQSYNSKSRDALGSGPTMKNNKPYYRVPPSSVNFSSSHFSNSQGSRNASSNLNTFKKPPISKPFENQYRQRPGEKCQICGLPIIPRNHDPIVYRCSGCGRGFVNFEEKLVTIEQYLDPNNVLQLENYEGFSAKFKECLQTDGKNSEMADVFARSTGIVTNFLGSYEPWSDLAKNCMYKNQMEEALYSFVMSLRDYPENAGFWLNIAQIAANFRQFDMANKAIFVVKNLNPYYEPLQRNINKIKALNNSIDKENKGLTEPQIQGRAFYMIGELALRVYNFKRAEFRLEQAIGFDENCEPAWHNLGPVYLHEEKYDKAEHALLRALEFQPDNGGIYYNLTALFRRKGDIVVAKEMIKEAIRLEPHNARFIQKLEELERETQTDE